MNNISGKDNEYQFVKYLNGKKISELNPIFRNLIDKLFPNNPENAIIESLKNDTFLIYVYKNIIINLEI